MSKMNARENLQRLAAFSPEVISPMGEIKRPKKTGERKNSEMGRRHSDLGQKIQTEGKGLQFIIEFFP
jgi:hypothetical protein